MAPRMKTILALCVLLIVTAVTAVPVNDEHGQKVLLAKPTAVERWAFGFGESCKEWWKWWLHVRCLIKQRMQQLQDQSFQKEQQVTAEIVGQEAGDAPGFDATGVFDTACVEDLNACLNLGNIECRHTTLMTQECCKGLNSVLACVSDLAVNFCDWPKVQKDVVHELKKVKWCSD